MGKLSGTKYKMADSLNNLEMLFVVSETSYIIPVSEYYTIDGTIVSSVIARTRLFTKTSQENKSNVAFRLLLVSCPFYHNFLNIKTLFYQHKYVRQ